MNRDERIKQYLSHATQCDQAAERVSDALARQTFRDAAACWREMAHQVRSLRLFDDGQSDEH
jgi:hypothetical protein